MKQIFKGKVRWFDNLSGDGIISDLENPKLCWYVHWSSIRFNYEDLLNPEAVVRNEKVKVWRTLEDGKEVYFTLYQNGFLEQIDTVYQIKGEEK